jgi:outer membrane beta-barrel protein
MKRFLHLLILVMIPNWLQAGENDLYDFLWLDPDKSVYVLQNKIYPKDHTFYVDLGYISGQSNAFQDTTGAQLKAGYYFKEEWAVELGYGTYSHLNNSTYESLKVINGAEPFSRKANRLTTAYLVWSPFYGKINTFNKIFYFDWSFGVGVGQLEAESNLDSVTDPLKPNTYKAESYNPAMFKTNLKFHLNRRVHLGLEFQNANFQAGSPKSPSKKEWRQLNDLIFSIGVSF